MGTPCFTTNIYKYTFKQMSFFLLSLNKIQTCLRLSLSYLETDAATQTDTNTMNFNTSLIRSCLKYRPRVRIYSLLTSCGNTEDKTRFLPSTHHTTHTTWSLIEPYIIWLTSLHACCYYSCPACISIFQSTTLTSLNFLLYLK